MKNEKELEAKQNARGFTLIELLTVILIIAVLTAIGLTIGSKMLNAAAKKRTSANMKLIMHAINIYEEECGKLPYTEDDENYPGYNGDNDTEDVHIPRLFIALRYGEHTIPGTINADYEVIWDSKIKPIVEKLPDNVFRKDDTTGIALNFVDGFGNPLFFEPEGGLGGTPRLVSAGLDKKFGMTNPTTLDPTLDEAKDNIYSDK